MALAVSKAVRTLAFPSISTGIYGYPIEEAAHTAVSTVRNSLREPTTFDEIIFCCFSSGDLSVYEHVLSA